MPRTLRFVPYDAVDAPRGVRPLWNAPVPLGGVSADHDAAAAPADASIENLRRHLLAALELELSTIPPYLCALYSIAPGTNLEAADVIRSVVMEEMLHMALVANVLNAVGHTEPIPFDEFAAPYPKSLPHSSASFPIDLRRFSKRALETFLDIERPASPEGQPQLDGYSTIGQFYQGIEKLLVALCARDREREVFTGKQERQVTPDRLYYGGGGDLLVVTDLDTAIQALRQITEQGEGVDDSIEDSDRVRFHDEEEVAHYFRFLELQKGRRFRPLDTPESGPSGTELPIDWDAVAPMCLNPTVARYVPFAAVHGQMVKFNRIYTRLLQTLGRAFGGAPEALKDAVPIMYELRYQAEALVRIPSPLEEERAEGLTVGPSFEWDDAGAGG